MRSAIAEDVDVIGLSCHSWEYLHFVPGLIEQLQKEAADIGLVVGGSVITPKDGQSLLKMGVDAVFGPDSTSDVIIERMTAICSRRGQMD